MFRPIVASAKIRNGIMIELRKKSLPKSGIGMKAIRNPLDDLLAEQALRPEQQEDQRDHVGEPASMPPPSSGPSRSRTSFSPKPMISPPMIAPGN
jgi:hypothetical protein